MLACDNGNIGGRYADVSLPSKASVRARPAPTGSSGFAVESPVMNSALCTFFCAGWLVFNSLGCFNPVPKQELGCTDTQTCPPKLVCDSTELVCRPPTVIRAIATAATHTCVTTDIGRVRCWGRSRDNRLGRTDEVVGDDEHPSTRGDLPLPNIDHTDTGSEHSCAATTDGRVYCWGRGNSGRTGYLGDGSNHPVRDQPVPLSAHAVAVSTGGEHSCALTNDGDVFCWGRGQFGRLGYGSEDDIGDQVTPDDAGAIALGGRATSVTAGGQHTCALLDTNNVRCWGNRNEGRLGYGTVEVDSITTPPANYGDVDVGAPVTKIVAGPSHTCAILESGNLRCWGNGADGRLGYASTDDVGNTMSPAQHGVNVAVGEPVVDVGLGQQHTCALVASGNVVCWGANQRGQLGVGLAPDDIIGDDEDPDLLGRVDLDGQGRLLAVGGHHTCVVMTDNRIRCWGQGHVGILGCGNCVAPPVTPPDTSCDIALAADTCNTSVWEP